MANELTVLDRDLDGDTNYNDETVARTYDAAGNLVDDGEQYEYVYDVWGRLRFVVNRDTSDTVAEYRYNGLGHRTGWHSDVTDDSGGGPDGEVDDYDPWYHFVYDDRWRVVAVYRAFHDPDPEEWAIDAAAKERFVYHNAGLDGYGGSSYIDAVVLRDRDANTAWEDEVHSVALAQPAT